LLPKTPKPHLIIKCLKGKTVHKKDNLRHNL